MTETTNTTAKDLFVFMLNAVKKILRWQSHLNVLPKGFWALASVCPMLWEHFYRSVSYCFVKMITSIFNMEMKGLTTCFVLCQYRGVDLRVISKVCIDTSSSFPYQISNWITWPLLKESKKVVNYLVIWLYRNLKPSVHVFFFVKNAEVDE